MSDTAIQIPTEATSEQRPGALGEGLARFQRRWQLGIALGGVLSALFFAGVALLALGFIDFFAAFPDPLRPALFALLVCVGLAALGYGALSALAFSRSSAAREADWASHDARLEVFSAWELSREPVPEETLARWLRQRTIDKAAARLAALPQQRAWPRILIRQAGWRLLGLAFLVALLFVVAPRPSGYIARRLLQPHADLPPFSPLVFTLAPQGAEVLYGSDLVVTAEIAGAAINAPVRVLTRLPGDARLDEAPAYREAGTRYSQKLEKVAAPVEIAFAVERARSQWLPIKVRTQPKISEVLLAIEPPAYTRLPRREFALGAQPLVVHSGTRVSARLTSNRPLSGGELKMLGLGTAAPGEAAGEETFRAEPLGKNALKISWVVRKAARGVLVVRDVLNTASESLEFEQKILPDERPTVTLQEPAGLVLATPDSELPLEFAASDDIGLARLALVRRLGKYRERSQEEPLSTGEHRQEFRGRLALAAYGLTPGQTIELNAEAADTNPTLLGVAVSETARVRIISREDYAERLRQQTTLEDFTQRYEAIDQALDNTRAALDAFTKATESGDAAAAEQARQNALEAHRETANLFGAIAKDFPIFEGDEKLSAGTREAMKSLFENARDLESLSGKSTKEQATAAAGLRERLGAAEQQVKEEVEEGKRAAKAGAVLESTQKFQELLGQQREVVKDLNRVIEAVRRGEMKAAQALPEMEKRQREVAAGLGEWERSLQDALKALPGEFGSLRAGAEQFLQKYREFSVPPVMERGAEAASKAEGTKAGEAAGEALALLEALARQKNAYTQAMAPGPEGDEMQWPPDLEGMMRQLMNGLCRRPGEGEEGEEPGGTGGDRVGGRSQNGYTQRGRRSQLPIYGPDRLRLQRQGTGTGIGSQGRPGQGGGSTEQVARQTLSTAANHAPAGQSISPEAVPEAYREAVKRYFSPQPTEAANPSAR